MKIKVLGGHGGLVKGYATTSFLIDDCLLLDAGNAASTLSIDEQINIENILISHCHMDHIKDLAFLSDNCFGLRKTPFQVYTHGTVKKAIKDHLLNDVVWPDFTKLPTAQNPTMEIHAVESEKEFVLGPYEIFPVKVNHPMDAMGFIIKKNGESILFTSDTGPTNRIWEFAHKTPNLKAIFTEVSFPNEMQKVADLSDHHTPDSINAEIRKMPKDIPIVLTHLKPNYREVILRQMSVFKNSRVKILEEDGEVFSF
ncbi:MAG TPA: 3',5'-cyclic-nucleotide phosphodiesterase [Bacteriovoracaceae bacterium]|nr:3',5'-cyclic-nucleotide phosphodiesterase [Bacteriovoracaceae bacterium]